MTHSRRLLCLLVALSLGGLVAADAAAAPRTVAVGPEGQLYQVLTGTYGELFPHGVLASPDEPVLAVDVVATDQTRDRQLVPGTAANNVEDGASLLYEDSSDTLFVLWQNRFNGIHSTLNLFALEDGTWSEVAEISGNPYSYKSGSQIAVTRDHFSITDADGVQQRIERTVLHLIWWEDGVHMPVPLYTPVILQDGEYMGWNPVYRLDELAEANGLGPLLPAEAGLAQAPRIETGEDGASVVIGFTDPTVGRLVGLEISLVPGEIGVLADEVRHQIIEVGHSTPQIGGPAFAQKVRHQIIEVGNRLGIHPAVIGYVANKVTQGPAPLDTVPGFDVVASKVRHQIIEVGADLDLRGAKPSLGRTKVVEVATQTAHPEVVAPPSLIKVSTRSEHPAPVVGDGPVRLHLSSTGDEVVVAWEAEGLLVYRESRNGGWTPPRALAIDDSLEIDEAHQLLSNRVRSRR